MNAMRRAALVFGLILVMIAPFGLVARAAGRVPLGLSSSGGWQLVFADEFDASSIDATKWNKGWFLPEGSETQVSGPINESEDNPYSNRNIGVAQGSLQLTRSRQYGAAVTTYDRFSFTGTAFIEARMYLPGRGSTVYNWPAFWTVGTDWPNHGEIDVMEGMGGSTCAHVHMSTGHHGFCSNTGPGWHTYGALWDAEQKSVAFYYDGIYVGSEDFDAGNQSQYIVIDNTSSAELGGPTVPSTVKVDYVRVWK